MAQMTPTHPRVLTLSEDAYRALLKLYPPTFREELGPHMLLTFRDCARDAYRRGRFPALVMLWLPTLLDLIRTAAEERAQKGSLHMNKEWLTRYGGTAMLIAGVLWAISGLGQFETLYWDDFGGTDMVYEVAGGLTFVAFLPLLIGLLGLSAYASSRPLRISAQASAAACVGAILSGFASFLDTIEPEWGLIWGLFLLSFVVLIASLLVYGLNALRVKPLPRWNHLPLAAALIAGIGFFLMTAGWEALDAAFGVWNRIILWALMGIGWMLLGYAMLPIRIRAAATI